MKFDIQPNGNLLISSDPQDAEMLADMKQRNGANDLTFLADLLEETGWSPNGQLMALNPEDIAALTDAPILTDEYTIEDDGSVTVPGKVWWFPNYMVTNFADVLIEKGSVEFTKGGEDEAHRPVEKAG